METDKTKCPFCKLINEGLPPHVIYENGDFFIMLDKESLGFGHCMIIPKTHVVEVHELDDETYNNLFLLAKKLAFKLKQVTARKAVAFVAFGSGLPHAHLHLVPHDTSRILVNPAEYVKNLSDEELKNNAEKLRALIGSL